MPFDYNTRANIKSKKDGNGAGGADEGYVITTVPKKRSTPQEIYMHKYPLSREAKSKIQPNSARPSHESMLNEWLGAKIFSGIASQDIAVNEVTLLNNAPVKVETSSQDDQGNNIELEFADQNRLCVKFFTPPTFKAFGKPPNPLEQNSINYKGQILPKAPSYIEGPDGRYIPVYTPLIHNDMVRWGQNFNHNRHLKGYIEACVISKFLGDVDGIGVYGNNMGIIERDGKFAQTAKIDTGSCFSFGEPKHDSGVINVGISRENMGLVTLNKDSNERGSPLEYAEIVKHPNLYAEFAKTWLKISELTPEKIAGFIAVQERDRYPAMDGEDEVFVKAHVDKQISELSKRVALVKQVYAQEITYANKLLEAEQSKGQRRRKHIAQQPQGQTAKKIAIEISNLTGPAGVGNPANVLKGLLGVRIANSETISNEDFALLRFQYRENPAIFAVLGEYVTQIVKEPEVKNQEIKAAPSVAAAPTPIAPAILPASPTAIMTPPPATSLATPSPSLASAGAAQPNIMGNLYPKPPASPLSFDERLREKLSKLDAVLNNPASSVAAQHQIVQEIHKDAETKQLEFKFVGVEIIGDAKLITWADPNHKDPKYKDPNNPNGYDPNYYIYYQVTSDGKIAVIPSEKASALVVLDAVQEGGFKKNAAYVKIENGGAELGGRTTVKDPSSRFVNREQGQAMPNVNRRATLPLVRDPHDRGDGGRGA